MAVFLCARKCVLVLLLVSLALSVARQTFDFIGRMWVPILVNFVHVFFLIFGLFGAWQHRPGFLVCSSFWMPVYLSWNVFLCCYYLNFEPLDRNQPILSFGSRFSRSYFVERMPFCRSSLNHTIGQWQLPDDCFLPYWYAEVVLSTLCFAVAFLAFDMALVYMCTFSRKAVEQSYTQKRRKSKTKIANKSPSSDLVFSPHPRPGAVNPNPNGARFSAQSALDDSAYGRQSTARPDSFDGVGGGNAGYMNSSFESNETGQSFTPHLDPSGNLVQNYRRRSSKKTRKRHANHDQSTETFQTIAEVSTDDSNALQQTPLAGRRRSRSQSANRRSSEQQRSREARSVSPIASIDSRSTTAALLPASEPSQPFFIPAPSPPATDESPNTSTPFGKGRPTRSSKGNLSLQDFGQSAARRLSVTEPRGLRNSNDSILNGSPARRQQQAQQQATATQSPLGINRELTASLVAFDEKSNTLVRYHEQLVAQQRSKMAEMDQQLSRTVDESMDSVESTGRGNNKNYQRIAVPPDPVIHHHHQHSQSNASPPQSSQDSGHATSCSSQNTPQHRIIGYEPALDGQITMPPRRPQPSFGQQPPTYHSIYDTRRADPLNAYTPPPNAVVSNNTTPIRVPQPPPQQTDMSLESPSVVEHPPVRSSIYGFAKARVPQSTIYEPRRTAVVGPQNFAYGAVPRQPMMNNQSLLV